MKYEAEAVRLKTGEMVKFGKGEKIQKVWIIENGTPVGLKFQGRQGSVTEVRLSDFSPLIRASFEVNGASQKIGDSYSGEDTVEACWETMLGMIEQLTGGDWASRGSSAESVLVLACAEAFGIEPDAARATLKEMTKAEREALKTTEPVKSVYARMMAERAPKGIDVEGLKAKFGTPKP